MLLVPGDLRALTYARHDFQESTNPCTIYGLSQEEQVDDKNSFPALLVLELVLKKETFARWCGVREGIQGRGHGGRAQSQQRV